jgi:hypothetical protein
LIIGMASNEGFRQHAMSGYPDLRLTEAVADLAYKHADEMLNERDL